MPISNDRARQFGTCFTAALISCSLSLLTFNLASFAAAEANGTSDRKVVARVEPEYPETLKRLYVGGVVRIEVVVNAQGKVESAQLLGGNPILGQSAIKAVKQWKYTQGSTREKLIVRLEFDPHR
jgi:TonB family protein